MSRVARLDASSHRPGNWLYRWRDGVPRAYLARLADLAPVNATVNISVAAVISGFLYVHADHAAALVWFAAHLLLSGLLLVRRRTRSSLAPYPSAPTSRPTRRGLYRALTWATLSGLLWGSLTAFLPEAPPHIQIVLILTMGGMAAGAAATLAAVPPVAVLFILGCTAPATAFYLLIGGEAGITLGFVFLVFMLAMIVTSLVVFSSLERLFDAEWHVQELETIGAALRESEQRFRATFENAAVGIAHVGLDGAWLRVNERVCGILGYSRDELMAGRFQDIVHADDTATDRALFDAMVRGGSSGYQIETRHRHKDGHQVWIAVTMALQRTGHGEAQYGIAVIQDVTARTIAEQALRESDRFKDQFLAMLGHELRNPMAPLRTALDVLLRAPPGHEPLDRLLPIMDRQLRHLTRLVDDLLDLSRISRGVVELRRAPHPLHQPITAAIEQTRPLIEERGHRLIVDEASADILIDADLERLTQVFANLLHNAARYMEPGGAIRVSSGTEGGMAVVRVRDQGRGIPPEALEQVFGLFWRIDGPEDHTGGLGIGLALSRRLIDLHGGSINAHSEGAGRGTEFVVRLPLYRPLQEL